MCINKKIDKYLIFSIIATGIMSFAGVIVETSMNVAFPTLMKEFNIGTSTVQWITTGYLLMLALIIPLSSFFKRRFKTKDLFITSLSLFILATIICAIAPSYSILLFGRIIQGTGTGIALPLMYNIVLEQTPKEKLGQMVGVASFITAIAPAVGPSVGGLILSYFGWRMIFIVLLPFLIFSFVLGIIFIQQYKKIEKINFNVIDYLFLVISFSCFIFATNIAAKYGWASLNFIILLLISIASISIFYSRSKKSSNPLIRVQVFKILPFNFSVLVVILIQFCVLALGYLIPNYSQIVSGNNAFISGLLLFPGCVVGAVLAPISGKILDSFGAKKPILTDNIIIIIALLGLSIYTRNLTTILFMLFYLIFASGQGLTVGNSMTNGLEQLPSELNTDGNAVFITLQQLAGATGTSVVTTIVADSQIKSSGDFSKLTMIGSQRSLILLVILSVISLICSLVVFKTRINYREIEL